MSMSGSMIADAAAMGPRYAKRLLTGIPTHRFARMSSPGGKTVESNHPAFILGHLCLYPAKVLELLAQDDSSAQPPAHYEQLFSKNASCQDDPDGTIYPAAGEMIECFERTYAAAIDALRKATEEQLAAANPVDTPIKEILPTVGGLLAFYMTGHVMSHLGQLSTWRRMEGLPPA